MLGDRVAGCWLGLRVGHKVEGDREGVFVGCRVGLSEVGARLGALVCCIVGTVVGRDVGELVVFVGATVGRGSSLKSSTKPE